MPLTDAEVITKLRNRGIGADLDDDEVTEAINAWIEQVQISRPLEALGTFTTVANQQEYDLFGSGGAFEGGLDLLELYGSSNGADQGIDIFSVTPLLQNLGAGAFGPPLNRDNYVFNVPGDFLISDRVWAAYRERFSRIHFYRKQSSPGSPVLLDPVPTGAFSLLARYTIPRSDAEVRVDDAVLMAGAEWKCLDILATKFALSAGTKIGDHQDNGKTAELFQKLADKQEAKALALLETRFPTTISPAERS